MASITRTTARWLVDELPAVVGMKNETDVAEQIKRATAEAVRHLSLKVLN